MGLLEAVSYAADPEKRRSSSVTPPSSPPLFIVAVHPRFPYCSSSLYIIVAAISLTDLRLASLASSPADFSPHPVEIEKARDVGSQTCWWSRVVAASSNSAVAVENKERQIK